MPKSAPVPLIRLRGVHQNNLKGFDLDLPLQRLIVVTGLSGSGKSSLAFDTLYAEGQRRYIETFSPYARQFFDRMDKPAVDSIEGIPPAIAIEQRNAVRTTRSTVGTMTEICDYMKVLWPQIAQLHCRGCGQPVRKDSPQHVWESIFKAKIRNQTSEILVTFDLPLSEKLALDESLALVAKQGFQRLLLGGRIVRLEEAELSNPRGVSRVASLTVVQDRLALAPSTRARFIEACEQAYHFGKGKLTVWEFQPPSTILNPRPFSSRLHCARCDLEYREPTPALFSFNHPIGACSTCKGFGRIISIDYNLAIPDRTKTLAEGLVKPWQTGTGLECQRDLLRMCHVMEIPTDVPFGKLRRNWQEFVIDGDPEYGTDEEHEWPRAWYGVKGYFRWLESKSYKMHMRVLLSRYRAYTTCPNCNGARLKPDALLYLLPVRPSRTHFGQNIQLTFADFYALTVAEALQLVEDLGNQRAFKRGEPLAMVLDEVRSRLAYLEEVGVGYLTLDRPTRTLSGGETERVSLTTCLGTRLVNTLFVLDEPSVGLHPRDTDRLVRILARLRDTGNTVVVVEHEPSVMRASDRIVDLGPGHGATGGQVVFQGSFREILRSRASLTGQYLSRRRRIEIPARRTTAADWLTAKNATRHNLRDLSVSVPLNRFVCITGVSGSGKSTLVREVLLPSLEANLKSGSSNPKSTFTKASDRLAEDDKAGAPDDGAANNDRQSAVLTGHEALTRAVFVDQAVLAKTPRSNPAVYIGAFDDIREIFSQSDAARQRGLNAGAFSFNSVEGQCERCRGAGFEKIEMQFLSDVFIRCPDCRGRRYREHVLEVKIRNPISDIRCECSIADLLEATVEEVVEFLSGFPESKPAQRAVASLKLLEEVGLGYVRLGQPINTLSGGESQRLKLVRHLAEATANPKPANRNPNEGPNSNAVRQAQSGPTLFLFDEPTTGLHFEDIRVLLRVFQRLVGAGHSLVVIEHNLEVIKCADWVIDLGPEAGEGGGRVVAEGTPEAIVACKASHTGRALRSVLH